jgi:hypothetical protein
MAQFLFDVEQRNRLEQKGLLKRFSVNCIGKQETLEDIRLKKADKYKELMGKRGTREYDMWFLSYSPSTKKRPIRRKFPRPTTRKNFSKRTLAHSLQNLLF